MISYKTFFSFIYSFLTCNKKFILKNGFNDPYCDSLKRQCCCGSCDPCNCALYCSDKRLNKLYDSGLTVGTCQCGSSKNGESCCQTLETQCVCSSPPPQGCNYNTNPCCQPVDGFGCRIGSESRTESGSGTESGSETESGTESGSGTHSNAGGDLNQIVIKRK